MTGELIFLTALIIILILAAAGMMTWMMRLDAAQKKFNFRLEFIAAPLARDAPEERISLSKSAQETERLKQIAENIIGVDLNQAEAYPIKWWRAPDRTC
jgi:tight adherence protein B